VTILSGPIGAGKTAVSKDLIGLLSGPLAYIEGDRFWPFLVKRAEGDRREDFRVIMRAMTSAAGSLARTGYDVLLDFSIPPAFLPAAQKILRDAPLNYIVLRPPLEVARPAPEIALRARSRNTTGASMRCSVRMSGTWFPREARAQRGSPSSSSRRSRRAASRRRPLQAPRHHRGSCIFCRRRSRGPRGLSNVPLPFGASDGATPLLDPPPQGEETRIAPD
jgi:hypothetical protein